MRNPQIGMLLAIDVGNSTVGLGLYTDMTDPDRLLTTSIKSYGLTVSRVRSALKILLVEAARSGGSKFAPGQKIAAISSSVVPSLNKRIMTALKDYCLKPHLIGFKSAGLKYASGSPEKIGADRLANAVAAFSFTHKPTAIADFGSATTITVVGRKGIFMGGAIMPGMEMMAGALAHRTAKLPLIKIMRPERALGEDTASAITSGIVLGTAGAAIKIISSISEETGLDLQLVITGGWAATISPFLERDHLLVPGLIFEGLRLMYIAGVKSR
jgi:type III pantothenate kinase